MSAPDPERQVQFLFDLQRLLSDGSFVATYKFALLLSLADLAVERGSGSAESLPVTTLELAEKFVDLYWRQVLPWMPDAAGNGGQLRQATGSVPAILVYIAAAHKKFQGSLARLRRDEAAWKRLLREVSRVIAVMPLWKLQTVGADKLDFLYPNIGRGRQIELRGEAVFCLRRFRDLIGDMTESAWVRFVRRLPSNRPLIGEQQDLYEFLFGTDRTALAGVRDLLRDVEGDRCFYCGASIHNLPVVDHFVPWARYPLDLGHNFVLADGRCNSQKADRLAAFEHLEKWCERNQAAEWTSVLEREVVPHDLERTRRVAAWAYAQAEDMKATVWLRGSDDLVGLDPRWRSLPGLR